ncbi:NAD(P)-dependent oxidoreductase [Chelativorans salis]|uniref:NAD(P)-dependent oxidoreductase n=1 Tax=Chelativorans salis TaxID=2978478 RepID=A0ABT2LHV3_9HYPH|nr:NAD(P)-dependent oxidoreductase [Chelativorans sp. EGI FJ00035]MCT7374085.1 NAD(P)-dependent oxidoreductase [Chelativorans sp. EGI FJ00035]
MARIALIGASGNVGQRLLKELSDRGHQVTAIARNPDKIAALPGVAATKGDVKDGAGLAALLKGHDAVISSLRFLDTDFNALLDAVRASGVKRYLIVGGAASLEVAPGVRLLDSPDFPDAYRAEATAGAEYLKRLREVTVLDWTFLSPSALFVPGERTGQFRLDKDQLLTSDSGSSISFEDYAIAMVDEIEKPHHIRQRFTVGY